MRHVMGFLGFALAAAAAALLAAWATAGGVHTWYPTLAKPAWTPPDAIFAPVWTVLYALMAISGYRVWRRRSANRPMRHIGLALWWTQLVLNAAWSAVFFAMHLPGPACAVLAVLWALLVAAQVIFILVDRLAAWLWIPYVLWVSFAVVLNFAIVRLN